MFHSSQIRFLFFVPYVRCGARLRLYIVFQSEFELPSSPYAATANMAGDRVNEKIDYSPSASNGDGNTGSSGERMLPLRSVAVAELRVRLPQNVQWVHVEKCQFIPVNRTLDTRLVFPDLTISGRVVVQPGGGECDMILRLRRAGIEFRTVPIMEGRSRAATVRTDSHFTEPGFISVFAHGCDNSNIGSSSGGGGGGPKKYRPNSKRKHFQMQRQFDGNVYGRFADERGRSREL